MIRRLIPASVLLAGLIGCGGKVEVPGVGSVGGGTGDNPDVTYTIKLREKQAGDRFNVTVTTSHSTKKEDQVGGKKKTDETNQGEKFEYSEVVEEVKDGRPTKVKRTYKVAEIKGKPTSFAGKTVEVQLSKPGVFSARVEKGGEILGPERMHFADAVGRPDQLAVLLPTRAIKVNETFVLDPPQLEKVIGPLQPLQDTRTGDGKLTKVYSKDGRQYGVFEVGVGITLKAGPETGIQPGSGENTVVVYDGCIDGSATDGEVKVTRIANQSVRDAKTGATRRQNAETVSTVTIRPATK
jgi:hypothetical protein